MNALRVVALVLVIVGAVNWGLVGLFQFDLVAAIGLHRIGRTLAEMKDLEQLHLL